MSNDTEVTTLTDFLLARIEEDEAVARVAADGGDGRWSVNGRYKDDARIDGYGIIIYDEGGHTVEQAQYIARHDPARILDECAAKRAIVERYSYLYHYGDGGGLAFDLRALASVYAAHEDYRDQWAS